MANLRKSLYTLGVILVFILSTSGSCDNSSSSGGSDGTIKNNACYSFDRVYLLYDFSSKHNTWNNMYYDASELFEAHDTDPTSLSGAITRLTTILYNKNNYPDERKPEIKVTINPVGYEPVIHFCSENDVTDDKIGNLPDYGRDVSSFIVSIKSITTTSYPAHGLTLCWSKTFQLNQQWWDYYKDKNLNAKANVTVLGYTKNSLSKNVVLLRKEKSIDGYRLIESEPQLFDFDEDEIIECEVEFLPPEKYDIPSVLNAPVYVGKDFNKLVSWESPQRAIIIE